MAAVKAVKMVNTVQRVALGSWPKVVLLGDSITQFSCSPEGCWGALLAARLQRKCDVVNRGFSGYNTRWSKLILPRIIDTADDVSAMTICLGTNDSNTLDNVRRHVPLAEYQDNLFHMVQYLQSVGLSEKKVILITPPACDEVAYTRNCNLHGRLMTKSQSLVGRYAAACQQVAEESGTQFVDLYREMLKQKQWQSLLVDGLHLSAGGSALMDSLVWPHVDKLTGHLPVIFPTYRQVDLDNPASSLLPAPTDSDCQVDLDNFFYNPFMHT